MLMAYNSFLAVIRDPTECLFDFETKTGMAIKYYTYGAAVSEVEIDTLTGEHQVSIYTNINYVLSCP